MEFQVTAWTIAKNLDVCGYDGKPIPAGDPMQEMRREGLTRVLKRCVVHAHGDVDWEQVDQARHAAEVTELNVQAASAPQPVRRPRLAFDRKLAAAGDDQ